MVATIGYDLNIALNIAAHSNDLIVCKVDCSVQLKISTK
jgi:hypothetical protein